MPTGWRIVKTRFAAQAFDGEEARLYGGRWNSRGTGMVYTSQSVALAVLEVFVHLGESGVLPSYSLCAAHFDDSLAAPLDRSKLPDNWRDYPAPSALRLLGDEWVSGQSSVVLEVPSAIIESESNYLINPSHPDFASVTVAEPAPFDFDPLLVER